MEKSVGVKVKSFLNASKISYSSFNLPIGPHITKKNLESFQEDLKLSNVDDIYSEILQSPEWYTFHKILLEQPNAAPDVCKRKCNQPQFYHKDLKNA